MSNLPSASPDVLRVLQFLPFQQVFNSPFFFIILINSPFFISSTNYSSKLSQYASALWRSPESQTADLITLSWLTWLALCWVQFPLESGNSSYLLSTWHRTDRCFWTGNGINRVKGKYSKVRRRNSVSSGRRQWSLHMLSLMLTVQLRTGNMTYRREGHQLRLKEKIWESEPTIAEERSQKEHKQQEKAKTILEMEATGRQGDKK